MGFLFSLVLCFYIIVSLCISVLILASEDGESISNSSPISPVRWTQKNSFLNYLISSLAFLFMLNCIILNRMRRYNLVNDIIMEANLANRKEDLPIMKKEVSKSDNEIKSDEQKTKSDDEKVEFQPKTNKIESDKESEKKVDSKKSQFKKFFGFGKEENEDKKDMKEKKVEFFSKPIDTEKKTSAKNEDLDDDLDQSLENSKEKDSKDSFKEDFIATFGDLLDGNEL